MLNPLRGEGEAFRALLFVIAFFGTIIAIILIARALSCRFLAGSSQRRSPASRPWSTVSRRPPLNAMCDRSSPSRTKPQRAATR